MSDAGEPEQREPGAAQPPPWAGAPGFHPEAPSTASEQPPAGNERAPAGDEPAPARHDPARPGYLHVDGLAAHAPMPGAPPYPAAEAPPALAPISARTDPPLRPALAAAAVWFAVNLVLWTILYGNPGTIVGIAAEVAVTLVVALIVWLIARRRQWVFWQLVLLAAPFYWIIRLVVFPRQPL